MKFLLNDIFYDIIYFELNFITTIAGKWFSSANFNRITVWE